MRRHGLFFSSTAIIPSSFSNIAKIALACLALLTGLSATSGTGSAAASEETGPIPADAIRIRIIANSDSSFDQRVKRDVRDRVAADIVSWGAMPGTHNEARALIQSHLDEIRTTADEALQKWNVAYGANVELAEVPFPDKTFGGRAYAAGDYEALRITLGGGEGANWWCVLFPPLCLTAATASEDPAAQPQAAQVSEEKDTGKPKPRSFFWEMLRKLG